MNRKTGLIPLVIFGILLAGCHNTIHDLLSPGASNYEEPIITAFKITGPVSAEGVVDQEKRTIAVMVPIGTDRHSLGTEITVSPAGAALNPGSGTAKGITTWVNEHTIFTSATSATLSRGANQFLTIYVTGSGYSNFQWSLNSSDLPGVTAASYTFSSAGQGNGNYTIGLRLKKDNAWYSTQVTVTVQN